jgi:hypothetical protein
MEHHPLERDRVEGVAASKAHIPSLKSWRRKNGTQTSTAFDEIPVSEVTGSQKSDSG